MDSDLIILFNLSNNIIRFFQFSFYYNFPAEFPSRDPEIAPVSVYAHDWHMYERSLLISYSVNWNKNFGHDFSEPPKYL
jgi:hypothetical protein